MADQTLYEIIQQQKHLKETEAKLVGLLEKIQSSINHLTVEELELTHNQLSQEQVEDEDSRSYEIEIKTEELNEYREIKIHNQPVQTQPSEMELKLDLQIPSNDLSDESEIE